MHLTVVAYINNEGGTHSVKMCALLWQIMRWSQCYHVTLKARHIPGCLNVMVNLLSRSNQVQSTDGSPSDSSPSQGDPKNQPMPLPDHRNSPRLGRDALVFVPSTALNRDLLQLLVLTTLLKQSHNYVFHSNPQHLNLHAWCLGVDSSKNKASLWR